jgi:membrane-associated protein
VLSYVLHLDKHMHQLIASLGGWIYALLFTIVFAETGLVVRASLAFHHTPTELP